MTEPICKSGNDHEPLVVDNITDENVLLAALPETRIKFTREDYIEIMKILDENDEHNE